MADKAKNLLERIKLLFAETMPTAYKLADGTDVTISLLDVGGDFAIGGQPAAEGTYTLMDGTNVVVDSTGKITSVQDPSQFASTEYTLADGTKVSIDKMEVGGVVMQGEAKIANGDYKLEDGSGFTTVDGIITAVTPKPAQEAPAANAKMTKEQVQQAYDTIATAAPDSQMQSIVTCVKALMEYCFGWQVDDDNIPEAAQDAQEVADALNAWTTLQAQTVIQNQKFAAQEQELIKTKELLTKALALMIELAEAPSADPPEGVSRKVRFSGEIQKNKRTALERYAEAAGKLNGATQES